MQNEHRWREKIELTGLFFLHAMAMGMWFVPLGPVLDANGYSSVKAWAFATSGVSAFISPLLFGALADQRYSPVLILRWLGLATACTMALAATAIGQGWPWPVVLALVQLHSLCSAPTWGISTTIVLARLSDAKRQFGPLRSMATVGWMVGCWIVSAMRADTTAWAGYSGAIVWMLVMAFTFLLPAVPPPASAETLSWKQRLGLDALALLRNRDHRVVFLTAALFNIPLCAFYPFTPGHLQQLGFVKTSAWLTLGQVTEIIAMLALAGLLTRWRLKTVFLTGIGFGVLRYVACAFDQPWAVLLGITLHGFAFTLFFITGQIYLEQRIDPAWRARAQALFTLMLGGIGGTLGYLGCGWWFATATHGRYTDWPLFWSGLALSVALLWAWFAWAYQGRRTPETVER